MLGWDAATMMPPGGGAARGDQLAVLAGLSHSLLSAPELGDDLAAAEAAGDASRSWHAANLRLMRQAYIRATAMPRDLVEAQARANSACEKVWREARRACGFFPRARDSWRRWCAWCAKLPQHWRRRWACRRTMR